MSEEYFVNEIHPPNQPNSISIKQFKILKNLAKSHICKISCNDGSHGTGFFCNISNDWNNNIKVLITNNHVLKPKDIQPGQTIKFSIDNDNKYYNIFIDKSRITYTNKSYDVTIIEIKENDNLDGNSFFDLDKQLFDENVKDIFKNNQIYLLHYPKGVEMEISSGVLKSIREDNITLEHFCDTSSGSSGSPIINRNNLNIIGIHKAAGSKNFNLGTLLQQPVEEFRAEIKTKNRNNNKINDNKENEKTIEVNKEKKEINNELNEKIEINKIIEKNNNKNNNEEKKKIKVIKNDESNVKRNNKESKEIKVNMDNESNVKRDNKESKEYMDNENNDEILIRYKIDYNENDRIWSKSVNLFGDEFIKKNSHLCKIILNGKENELDSYCIISKKDLLNNNIFEIKLKGIKNITNMSYIFNKCESLVSLPDISKWNTQNVTDMRNLFSECKSLSSLGDISKWNTQNVTDMSYMFYRCESLKSLPDISNWNTKNVKNIEGMFCECLSLSSLPDISKWDIQNVCNMNFMFSNCISLSSLPNISKWNTKNVIEMIGMFNECRSLESIPDISKWNIEKVENAMYMFDGTKLKIKMKAPLKLHRKGCFII